MGEKRGGGSCRDVPVKYNANHFLLQNAISVPFHGLGVAIH